MKSPSMSCWNRGYRDGPSSKRAELERNDTRSTTLFSNRRTSERKGTDRVISAAYPCEARLLKKLTSRYINIKGTESKDGKSTSETENEETQKIPLSPSATVRLLTSVPLHPDVCNEIHLSPLTVMTLSLQIFPIQRNPTPMLISRRFL